MPVHALCQDMRVNVRRSCDEAYVGPMITKATKAVDSCVNCYSDCVVTRLTFSYSWPDSGLWLGRVIYRCESLLRRTNIKDRHYTFITLLSFSTMVARDVYTVYLKKALICKSVICDLCIKTEHFSLCVKDNDTTKTANIKIVVLQALHMFTRTCTIAMFYT